MPARRDLACVVIVLFSYVLRWAGMEESWGLWDGYKNKDRWEGRGTMYSERWLESMRNIVLHRLFDGS